jgi:putative ABC transport system permease protein
VLALVAMFTGAFLVFSILSLSVAKRQQQLALLGVLGLPARGRLALVLGESALLGLVGSLLASASARCSPPLPCRCSAAISRRLLRRRRAGAAHRSRSAPSSTGALASAPALVGGWLAGARRAGDRAGAGLERARSEPPRPSLDRPRPVQMTAGIALACCRRSPACRSPPTPRSRAS